MTDHAEPYDDSIVRRFYWATLFWFMATVLAGGFGWLLKVAPETFAIPELAYGRMRPLHTNMAMFGLVANAIFVIVYHSTQRLCARAMASPGLSRLHFYSWQFLVASGCLLTPLGITTGKEYAEWEWPIDIAMAISWIGFFAVNFTLTLSHRRQPIAYISLWFYGASIVVISMVQLLAAAAVPVAGWTSLPLFAGVADAAVQWFYGHDLIAFLLTAPLIGGMYYYVPKMVKRPVHSYPLAIMHFWSLTMLTLWAAPHHLHFTTLPDWLSSLGMLFGIAILMPSIAGVVNGWQTIRSGAAADRRQPHCRFIAVSLAFYGIVILLGTLQAIKTVNAYSHYTDFMVAYAHTAVMGFTGMMILGIFYYLLPQLFQSPLYSNRLVSVHLYMATLGTVLYVAPHYWAGIQQGYALFSLNQIGNLATPEFTDTLPAVVTMWKWSAIGAAIYLVGLLVMVYNTVRTWAGRAGVYDESYPPAEFVVISDESPTTGESRLSGVPVLNVAKRLERVGQLDWHSRYEMLPRRIMLPVMAMVVLSACFELMPVWWIARSDAATVSHARYTPLELLGRDIYRREGCVNCHSQTVRPLVSETKRYGAPSEAVEFAHDRPFLWGSRRVGPDLAREGGVRSSLWQWQHLIDPRSAVESSVMPSFVSLAEQRYDVGRLVTLWEATQWMDAPAIEATFEAGDEENIADGIPADASDETDDSDTIAATDPAKLMAIHPASLEAHAQAERVAADVVSQGGPLATRSVMTFESEAIALIAYLQRLGAPVQPPSADEMPEPAPALEPDPASELEPSSKGSESANPQSDVSLE